MHIKKMAEIIIERESAKEKSKQLAYEREYANEKNRLYSLFVCRFVSFIELFESDGIKWDIKPKDPNDINGDWYIEFELGGYILKMDFASGQSFRLEYTDKNPGSMVYGDWDDEKFVMFLYDGLIKKHLESPKDVFIPHDDVSHMCFGCSQPIMNHFNINGKYYCNKVY